MKLFKVLLYIGIVVLALIGGLGLMAKKTYHVERSVEIDAPKAMVLEQVQFFKNFKNWSPWHVLDPQLQSSISGTDGASGAAYEWSGNDKIGKGRLTLKSVSDARIDLDIALNEWGVSPAYFAFEEKAGKTFVRWAMDMYVPFPWNIGGMFTDLNTFVGKDFDRGLDNLKQLCEKAAFAKYFGYHADETELPEKYYIGIRKVIDTAEVATFMAATMKTVMAELETGGFTKDGAPTGIYYSWADGKCDMISALPVKEVKKPANGLSGFAIAGGKALVIEHFGSSDSTFNAHRAMSNIIAEKGYAETPPVIEDYVTDPASEPDTTKWLTRIIYFVKPK